MFKIAKPPGADPMLILSREEGHRQLSPHYEEFVRITNLAWQDWSSSNFARQLQRPVVRANLIWNQIISHGKTSFYGNSMVRVDRLGNWDGFVVNDSIFIRPKYARVNLLSSNYPTLSAESFHDQTVDLFGGVSRVDLVYQLDGLQTKIETIALVQRHLNKILWSIVIDGEKPIEQFVIPFVPVAPVGSPADRIIKPKTGDQHASPKRQRGGGKDI